MEDTKTLATIYREDQHILKKFMEKQNAKKSKAVATMADAIRICVQYANAHGALK